MSRSIKIFCVFCIILIATGIAIYSIPTSFPVPESHKEIVERLTVTTFSHTSPMFVLVGECVLVGYEVPYQGEDVTEPKIPISVWIYRHREQYPRFYGADALLKIWGPFEDIAYNIEVARLCGPTLGADALRVYLDGNIVFTFTITTKTQIASPNPNVYFFSAMEGYASFSIHHPIGG